MPISDSPPGPLDQLFAAPLKTFVAERKRLADQLKAAGKAQAAKELAKTARPSIAAWIVNQLARQDGPLLRELAELTDRLRGAQGQAARGARRAPHGSSDESASDLLAAHRDAIKRLRGRAEEILLASGQAVRPAILDQVLRNLRLGMADAAVRPIVESGRLIEDVAAEEGFAGLFGPVGASSEPAEPAESAAPVVPTNSAKPIGGDDPETQAHRAAADAVRLAAARAAEEAKFRARAQAERARARGVAEVRIRTLQARADGAHRSLEKAHRNVDAARQALAQAEDDLRAAQLAAETCAKQLADAEAVLDGPR